jgi:hypothetical protein
MPRGRIHVSTPMSYPTVSRLLRRFTFIWGPDKDGNADGEYMPPVAARLLRVLIVPGTNAERPRDDYGVTLIDRSGVDTFGGKGRGFDGGAATDLRPVDRSNCDALELRVAGAGLGASGRVILFVRERTPA